MRSRASLDSAWSPYLVHLAAPTQGSAKALRFCAPTHRHALQKWTPTVSLNAEVRDSWMVRFPTWIDALLGRKTRPWKTGATHSEASHW